MNKEVFMYQSTKKYVITFFVMFTFAVMSFCGCGSEEVEEGKYTSLELMEKVRSGINDLPEVVEFTETTENADKILGYLTDTDMDKIKSFAYIYSEEGKAEEIAIIELKKNKDVNEVMNDLKERIETRKNCFITYDEEEVKKFDAATVVVKDNYVMMIIGNQANNGKYEFNKAFE